MQRTRERERGRIREKKIKNRGPKGLVRVWREDAETLTTLRIEQKTREGCKYFYNVSSGKTETREGFNVEGEDGTET